MSFRRKAYIISQQTESDSCLTAFLGQVSMLSIHPYGSHVIPVYRGIWSVFQMSISLSSLPRRYMES
uniref:Uncharacterized protein n=1 Tax=Brassica oleracea var. oleracea TaxID=109376 RepID=A0A0D3D3W1_BRAOL